MNSWEWFWFSSVGLVFCGVLWFLIYKGYGTWVRLGDIIAVTFVTLLLAATFVASLA